jgi:uncharacterized repeat protein (TIGR01451 family)
MESWGELFWDAWIRFRLWCRSLSRACWPPRIEAWQVCTVTGVAAIVLTVLSLRNQANSAAKTGQSQETTTTKTEPLYKKSKELAGTPAVDPYLEAQAVEEVVVVEEATPVNDDIKLDDSDASPGPSQSEIDKEFADIGPNRPARTMGRKASLQDQEIATATEPSDVADKAEPAAHFKSSKFSDQIDTAGEGFQFSNTRVPEPEEPGTASQKTESNDFSEGRKTGDDDKNDKADAVTDGKPAKFVFDSPKTSDSETEETLQARTAPLPEPELEVQPDEPSSVAKTKEEHASDVKTEYDHAIETSITENAQTEEQTTPRSASAKKLSSRKSGHYARPDHEEHEPASAEIPVARRKEIEFTAPPPVAKATVRAKGHYRSFGDDEESNQDSDQQPRAARIETENAAPDAETSHGGTVEPQTPEQDADKPTEPLTPAIPKADSDEFALPKVPAKRLPPIEAAVEEEPAVERPNRELPLPPSEEEAHPAEATPTESIRIEAVDANIDAGPRPPILIAAEETPRSPVLSTESADHEAHVEEDAFQVGKRKPPVTLALPGEKKDFHGPVLSTDSVDHDAHMKDDAFNGGKRKFHSVIDVPASKPAEFHGPVQSTDSVDHETHMKDDAFSGGKRKFRHAINLPPSKPAEFHGPFQSTESVDHEAHMEEDSISGGNSKSAKEPADRKGPSAKIVKPSVEHQTRQPVSTDDVVTDNSTADRNSPRVNSEHEPADEVPPVAAPKPTAPAIEEVPEAPVAAPEIVEDANIPGISANSVPRTSPRTAPQVVGHDEEESERIPTVKQTFEPSTVNESEAASTAPMTEVVPQPRAPARIAVPQRIPMPDETAATGPRARASAAPATTPRTRRESVAQPTPTKAGQPIPRAAVAPRLEMEITGPKKVPVGTQVVLHFKIKNVGNAVATGIMVSDVLPPGMQHRLSPDLEYAIASLAPGETRETNLTVQCTAAGVITNRAVLNADGEITTEASLQVEVTGSAAATRSPVTVSHRGPERWLVDSTGQFLVTVTNTSGQRLRDVTITETFPLDTNLVHATVGHKADPENRTVSWTISDFAAGAAYILETELHSTGSGPQTTTVKVKVGGTEVAEDRWTAVSYSEGATQ